DRLDDLGRSVGLADALQARVATHADNHAVLAAGGLGLDILDPQDLTNDLSDLHTAAWHRVGRGRTDRTGHDRARNAALLARLHGSSVFPGSTRRAEKGWREKPGPNVGASRAERKK